MIKNGIYIYINPEHPQDCGRKMKLISRFKELDGNRDGDIWWWCIALHDNSRGLVYEKELKPLHGPKCKLIKKVMKALLKQGCKSVSKGGCRYRGDNGTKCAVGHLIPDNLYLPSMEEIKVFSLFLNYPQIEKLLGRDNQDVLADLQDVHDLMDVSRWEEEFKKLLVKYEGK